MEVPKDIPDDTTAPHRPWPPTTAIVGRPRTESATQHILEDGEGRSRAAPPVIGPRLNAAATSKAGGARRVPNFVGKSMRVVLAEAAEKGILVSPNGQRHRAGLQQRLRPVRSCMKGSASRVQFSR
jgi:hypothetical protein